MKTKHYALISLMTCFLCSLWSLNAYGAGGGGAFCLCQEETGGGVTSTWNYAGKTGIGTSYEQYVNEQYSDSAPTGTVSKVWFSITQGIITETAYGLIHEAQIKDLQFLVTGTGFFDEEKQDTTSQIHYLYTDSAGRPLSLAYKVINTDNEGKYTIEKHIFTDPDRISCGLAKGFLSMCHGLACYGR